MREFRAAAAVAVVLLLVVMLLTDRGPLAWVMVGVVLAAVVVGSVVRTRKRSRA